jgi:cytochrome c55X
MNRSPPLARTSQALALALALALLPATAGAEPSSLRQAELRVLLDQDCGSCHGLARRGGLGPPLLPESLAARSDAELLSMILNGSTEKPMPPWGFLIDAEDAAWLVTELRRGPSYD